MSVKWNKSRTPFFSLKQRWQKHHAEIAEHRSKADFFSMELICQLTEVLLKRPVQTLAPAGVCYC